MWKALTEPGELSAWWGDATVDLVADGDFEIRWRNTDYEGNRAVMHARIVRLDPPHLLETEGDMHGVLRWELRPDGDGTLLTFTGTLELPEEYRTKVLAGWHVHLDALAEVLDGGQVDLVALPGWERVHEAYLAREAGSEG